jgi:hypothetical protein
MPFFKSTYNILTKSDEDEVFDPNWSDSDKLILPPTKKWDYLRPLQIEDIDIWEVIYEQGGGLGLYAAWCPYAEFYMITNHLFKIGLGEVETYYGPNSSYIAYKRSIELGMPVSLKKMWVEDDEAWLHDTMSNTLLLPK